jgi:Matrixin
MAAGEPHETGDSALRSVPLRLAGAVVGLLCGCLANQVAAQDAEAFRVLKLEGHQVRWSLPVEGGPRVVTYRMVNETLAFPTARNCRGLAPLDGLVAGSRLPPAAVKAEAAAAFAMWEAAANIVFKEAPEGGPADILIGAQTEPDGWAFADVFYATASSDAVKPITQALLCLNPAKPWKVGFNGDLKTYDLRYTLAHEIGHAIGLDHPSNANQIMNYRYEERFRALQPGDIRGAVALYGSPSRPALVVAAEPQLSAETAAASRALGK